MRKLILAALLLALLIHSGQAQTVVVGNEAYNVRFGASDPTTCNADSGQVFFNTTSDTLKVCSAINTWTEITGSVSSVFGLTGAVGSAGTADGQVLQWLSGAPSWSTVGTLPRVDSDGTVSLLSTDRNGAVYAGHASANAVSIAQATTAGFEAGYVTTFCTTAAGLSTITPTTSTINGTATLKLAQDNCALIISDGTNYRAAIYKARIYMFLAYLGFMGVNPLDITTYYGTHTTGLSTTDDARSQIVIPVAGSIDSMICRVGVRGTLGTNETSTATLGINGSDTGLTVPNITFDAVGPTSFTSTGGPIVVAAGDIMRVKLLTPTFTTNPTTADFSCWARLKQDQ